MDILFKSALLLSVEACLAHFHLHLCREARRFAFESTDWFVNIFFQLANAGFLVISD